MFEKHCFNSAIIFLENCCFCAQNNGICGFLQSFSLRTLSKPEQESYYNTARPTWSRSILKFEPPMAIFIERTSCCGSCCFSQFTTRHVLAASSNCLTDALVKLWTFSWTIVAQWKPVYRAAYKPWTLYRRIIVSSFCLEQRASVMVSTQSCV